MNKKLELIDQIVFLCDYLDLSSCKTNAVSVVNPQPMFSIDYLIAIWVFLQISLCQQGYCYESSGSTFLTVLELLSDMATV